MYPRLLENGVIQTDYENYAPWPAFRPLGSNRIGGLWRAHFLREILCREDLDCAAWRKPIPPEILRTLQHFPDCHCELIEMAQAVPERFLELARRNPALLLLTSTYWSFRESGTVPTVCERVSVWENLDDDQMLGFVRYPASRSFLKALSKVPASHAYAHRVNLLRAHWADEEKRRLLRHLPAIAGENLWLCSCFPPILDPAIHRLAAREPKHEEFSILEVISSLANRRELLCMDHWPYRNRIHTWPQLLAAYNRFLIRNNHVAEIFPPPPVDGAEAPEFHVVPLKSRTALCQEARQMLNCIENYSSECSHLKRYAYRLLHPERATVLIKRQGNRWIIEEAMVKGNDREVRTSTMRLLCGWVKSHRRN